VLLLAKADFDEKAFALNVNNSRPAFREVFDRHAQYVWRALTFLGVGAGDIEDASQEVFVVVHRRLDEWEGRGDIRTWLYGICYRVASAHRRRAHRRHETLVAQTPEEEVIEDPEITIDMRRRVNALEDALSKLDDERRAIFVLHEIEGLPMREVASILECPLHTAYGRFYAARRQIADALGVAEPDTTP
jgi:RNA polymerase sigma-70 factor (ECF subfamily)